MNDKPLITKYRPTCFAEFFGNESVIQSLASTVGEKSRPHAYLCTGITGVGKTTLARIIAKEVDAAILEIDAASHSGVDDMRDLVKIAAQRPITKEPNSLYIIDECHTLSKKAWDVLLKLLEEPPPYFYLVLCTTESATIPKTIRSRCFPVTLRPLKPNELDNLITTIAELESWPLANETISAMIAAADGSARRALTILQAGHAAQTKDELGTIIATVATDESPEIELAKFLMKGGRNWRRICQLLEKIENEEEAIMNMSRWLVAAMARSEEKQAQDIYVILRSFSETNTWDKRVHLYAAVGKVLWGQLPF